MKPATTRRSPWAPPARFRGWLAALAAGSAVLAGCGEPVPPEPVDPSASTRPPSASSGPGSPVPPAHGPWGAHGTRDEACAAVAADVLTLSLLPSSLPVSRHVEDVQRVEDQVETMVDAAPPPLVAEYARVQLMVDSYGEDLAAEPSPTAGPSVSAERRFDDRALEESLDAIRAWLTQTCQDRR
ncbi:hypothetical protein GCM10011374_41230 [Kocuria dechangensis]|uniref:Lipoprotein n=1 Tax=Kocuria dechangensis TaxID=1176249 RepID=A0A917H9R7_9MICC|nr:hypothetical protein [Kocuria dechangensis]GGG72213.1 hypothetical protein GCM10011374_41230 [Kocuria dechangensis]